MAALPAITVAHADQPWPVAVEFWEQWLLDLLGEAEGSYVLGLLYGRFTNYLYAVYGEEGRGDGRYPTQRKAEGFFVHSALAGHLPGAYAVSMTSGGRANMPFTHPPPPPYVEILPIHIASNDANGEARYWLARSADAGYWKSAAHLGEVFINHPDSSGEPDYAQSDRYARIAAKNGVSGSAYLVRDIYLEDRLRKTNRCEGFYTYEFLGARLENDGILPREVMNSATSVMRGEIRITPDQRMTGNEICLREEVINTGVEESKRLYDAWRAKAELAEQQRNELYGKAQARIPEVRAAFEAIVARAK
jgi:hypothetical protein